jgi:hypothetical protein
MWQHLYLNKASPRVSNRQPYPSCRVYSEAQAVAGVKRKSKWSPANAARSGTLPPSSAARPSSRLGIVDASHAEARFWVASCWRSFLRAGYSAAGAAAAAATGGVGGAAFLAAVFFMADLAGALAVVCALRNAAQRFLVAAIIRARPSALSSRFGDLAAADFDDVVFDCPALKAAHRFFCASAIRRRAAGLRTRLTSPGTAGARREVRWPPNWLRKSAMRWSIRLSECRKPTKAARRISGSSLGGRGIA